VHCGADIITGRPNLFLSSGNLLNNLKEAVPLSILTIAEENP
jgi:hypothetical protein